MKKIIIVLIAVLALMTGCRGGQDNNAGSGGEKEDMLHDFKAYTAEADNPAEVKGRLDLLLKNTDSGTSDSLIRQYLIYMDQVMSGETAYGKDLMEKAGFKYISVEGDEQPVIDYHFIDAYSGNISKEMVDFAKFMALNSDKPWAMDGGLVITLQDLADRIALGERFIVSYPDSNLREQVELQYRYYLISFLGGLDNTPLVDYDNSTVNKDFITAFEYFQETYPELKTAETVAAFHTELKEADFASPYTYEDQGKRDAFRNHLDQLANDAKKKLDQ